MSAVKDPPVPASFPPKITPKPSGGFTPKPPGVDVAPASTPWAAPVQCRKSPATEPQVPAPVAPPLPAHPAPKFNPSPTVSSPKLGSKPSASAPGVPPSSMRFNATVPGQTRFTAPSAGVSAPRPQPPTFAYAQQREKPPVQEKLRPTGQPPTVCDKVRRGVLHSTWLIAERVSLGVGGGRMAEEIHCDLLNRNGQARAVERTSLVHPRGEINRQKVWGGYSLELL